MFKQYFSATIRALVCLFCLSGSVFAVRDEITLLMVPRSDETAMKLGLDVANRHPATLLIGYLADRTTVSLHGWDGSQWVNITPQDFQAGAFFREGPTSALLVEAEGSPIVPALVPPESWCPKVGKIATVDPRPMIHLVGRYYEFDYNEWEWFAQRYSMTLEQINPEGLNVRWYHRRMSDNISVRKKVVADDLNYWMVLRKEMPPVVTPVEVPVIEEPVEVETQSKEDATEEKVDSQSESQNEQAVDPVVDKTDEPKKEAKPAAIDAGVFGEEVAPAIVVETPKDAE